MEDKNLLIKVGSRIRSVRWAIGITQKKMAEETGVNAGYLSEIETGKKSNFGFEIINKISKHYRVSLDYLVHGVGDMFLPGGRGGGNFEQVFIDGIQSIGDLCWFMDHSRMFRDIVMGYASKTLFENEEIIKRSIERYISKEEEKKHETNEF